MPGTQITFGYPSNFVRPIPNSVFQQKSNSQGNLAAGASSWDLGSKVILDTHWLTLYPLSGAGAVDGTAQVMGKRGFVAAFADQPCEIRLFFGGSEGSDAASTFALMLQVQDYAPMFVPNTTALWTVWRNIVITDRFWVATLNNVGAGNATSWRIHWGITDAIYQ